MRWILVLCLTSIISLPAWIQAQSSGGNPPDTYNVNYEASRNFDMKVEVTRFTEPGVKVTGTNEKFDVKVSLGPDAEHVPDPQNPD